MAEASSKIYDENFYLSKFPLVFDFYIRNRENQMIDLIHPARFFRGL